jgi:flagellar basal-body rod protein FlgB
VFDDVTSVALNSALDSLAQRQRTTADNISNINTPGFLAGKVSFEDSLRTAIADGDPSGTTTTVARSLEPTREDGNNVNLDEETLSEDDTSLRYSLMLRAEGDQFGFLKTAMS